MSRRLFSHDELTGVTKYFHYDDDTDKFTIETVQPMDELLELNQLQRNEQTRLHRFGDGKKVATIPMSIWGEWMATGKDKDPAFIKRWLNDPENRKYRTFLGKV
jgi:hypothetical protein